MARLTELKALGVRLAIDDFGTGYSSLSQLQTLPVDTLKIDKSFIDAFADGADGVALVATIISLAQTLGLDTIAEGVEHDDQASRLEQTGCLKLQGYLFSRPVPAETMGFELTQLGAEAPELVAGGAGLA